MKQPSLDQNKPSISYIYYALVGGASEAYSTRRVCVCVCVTLFCRFLHER